jgi:pSer/pThr/pTyr-binding forkhead associated (FHA) protein
MPSLLKIRLSLKGRPLRSFTFDKQTISIGRDPTADIFLDNTGVSRQHAQIDRTPTGYVLEDLGSANGTFLNEMVVTREVLGNDDVVRIGKFHLWMGLESDRRDPLLVPGRQSPEALQGTMILSAEQMVDLTRKTKAGEQRTQTSRGPASSRAPVSLRFMILAIGVFAIGIFLGAAVVLRALH